MECNLNCCLWDTDKSKTVFCFVFQSPTWCSVMALFTQQMEHAVILWGKCHKMTVV